MATIRQHEGDPCKWCNATKYDPTQSTCVWRSVPDPPKEGRRVLACEDASAISARMAELEAERKAWLERPAE